MKRILQKQSAFFNLGVLIGLFVVLSGVFLALLSFGAFPASPSSSAKAQNTQSSISQPATPADLVCQNGTEFCVQTYANFDSDLVNILARRDNTIRPVNATQKSNLINTMKTFAGSIGIPSAAIRRQPSGRWYGKTLIQGEIDAYYKLDAEPDLRSSAVVKARKTTRFRTAVPPISNNQLKQIADGTLAQWHVPVLAGDTLTFASHIHTREVDDDDTGPRVITERVGYYRSFVGRQVVNSTIKVEIDPSSSLASGLSLRAFWPVLPPQATALKDFGLLKSDVLKALQKNGSRSLTLDLTECRATYYQAPAVLIPSVTCTGQFINPADGERDDDAESVSVDVSLATAYSLDESDAMSVYTSNYPDGGDMGEMESRPVPTEPSSCAETSGTGVHAFYTTDEDRFYDGAKAFFDEWDTSSYDAYLGLAWHDSRFVETPCDQYGADWSDIIYLTAHGSCRSFTGENGKINTARPDTDDLTQLGSGDAEYLISASCSTASAIYCYGRSAVARYTDLPIGDWRAVFDGLHIFSGHHGTSINSTSSRQKNRARTLSDYIKDGLTIIEAWEDTADDVSRWNSNAKRDCGEMDDPATGCSFKKPWNDCARWSAYASSFYQKGKKYVTIKNRASYSDDIFPDDSDYNIDLRYQYQTETVPIYSPGHSLP